MRIKVESSSTRQSVAIIVRAPAPSLPALDNAAPPQAQALACTEFLQDNSFEIGGAWTGAPLTHTGYSSFYAHTGEWSVFLSTYAATDAAFWQMTTPSAQTSQLILTFYALASSNDPDDKIAVNIYDQTQTTLLFTLPLTYATLNEWLYFSTPLPVDKVAGKQIYLKFQTSHDNDTDFTEVNFDDVSLSTCASTPAPAPTATPTTTATPPSLFRDPVFTDSGQRLGNYTTYGVVLGDLDGDGDLDGVSANFIDVPTKLWENVDGVFTEVPAITSTLTQTLASYAVALGDLDGDADLDIVLGNALGNRVFRNEGGFKFTKATQLGDEITRAVSLGDLDGDGDLDIFDGNVNVSESGFTFVGGNRVWRNEGAFQFTEMAPLGTMDSYGVALGDLDGDGDLDAYSGNQGANIVWRNEGGFAFTQVASLGNALTYGVALADLDGDNDLDLLDANSGDSKIWRNNGNFSFTAAASPALYDTRAVAAGDLDGDGDLDVLIGHDLGYTIWQNRGAGNFQQIDESKKPPSAEISAVTLGDLNGDGALDALLRDKLYLGKGGGPTRWHVALGKPDITHNANFFASPVVLKQTTLAIPYILFDARSRTAGAIRAYYSLDGGGQWLLASSAQGTPLTNLAASPSGVAHTFTWQAGADLIKNDHIAFRIEAYPRQQNSGPSLWPYSAAATFPFRAQAAQVFARLVTENGPPIAGGEVYVNGQVVTSLQGTPARSDRAGLIKLPNAAGQPLVALAQIDKQPTVRAAHDGWAYRVYRTSLALDAQGEPQPQPMEDAGEQRRVLSANQLLVLFNLVVSIEWDADVNYTQEISRALQLASDYLYDVSDGQMAFGQVAIYDNAEHWADADIQISTKNMVHPHAFVGGIQERDTAHVIRVGRYWDGDSGAVGPWDEQDGYRTMVHEFGHYALFLYDEYVYYEFDANGYIKKEHREDIFCTANYKDSPPSSDLVTASMMYRQYETSELDARNIPGLWSEACQSTIQWQFNKQSAWETVASVYSNTVGSFQWQLTTPINRGSALPGPTRLPRTLLNLPVVTVHNLGALNGAAILLSVTADGKPFGGALVALNRKKDGRVLEQGITNLDGRITIFGAESGDEVRVISVDGGWTGSASVGAGSALSLPLRPVGAATAASPLAANPPPFLRVFPASEPVATGQNALTVVLQNFDAPTAGGNAPIALVTEPGSLIGQTPQFTHDASANAYIGKLSFTATQRGLGRLQVIGFANGQPVTLHTTYYLQRVDNSRPEEIFADDGNLHLHLMPGSLSTSEAYLLVMPPGQAPGAFPAGLRAVGNVYDITASGSLLELEKPAALELRYDRAAWHQPPTVGQLGLYRWNPTTKTWVEILSSLDTDHQALIATIQTLGMYVLLAPSDALSGHTFFLPFMTR